MHKLIDIAALKYERESFEKCKNIDLCHGFSQDVVAKVCNECRLLSHFSQINLIWPIMYSARPQVVQITCTCTLGPLKLKAVFQCMNYVPRTIKTLY